jgi:hypothetical protein
MVRRSAVTVLLDKAEYLYNYANTLKYADSDKALDALFLSLTKSIQCLMTINNVSYKTQEQVEGYLKSVLCKEEGFPAEALEIYMKMKAFNLGYDIQASDEFAGYSSKYFDIVRKVNKYTKIKVKQLKTVKEGI